MNDNSLYEWDSFVAHKPIIRNEFFYANEGVRVFPPHLHSVVEMLYVIRGELQVEIGVNTYELGEGDICFIDSFLPHSGVSKSDRLEYQAMQIPPKVLERFAGLDEAFEKFINREINIQTVFKNSRIGNVFKTIGSEYVPDSEKKNLVLTGLIYQLFGYLLTEHISSEKNSLYDSKQFGDAVKYINENYAGKISIRELSKRYSFDPSYFCRKFKDIIGVTPSNYICIQRLAAAESLLRLTNFSIEIISQRCGFESSNYFIRKFKEKYDLSPLQYRKSCANSRNSEPPPVAETQK